jgi:membrane-anchored glycerophosphoryl diester phosphodiesterase (GDPDase)
MELIIILYLVNFIRTIIIIVAIYFALKLFTRYVLPLILENKIRQMQQNMNERSRNQTMEVRRKVKLQLITTPQIKINPVHRMRVNTSILKK